MNFHNLNFDHVEAPRHWPPQFQTYETSSPADSESTIQQLPRPTHHRHQRQRHQPATSPSDSSSTRRSLSSQLPTIVPRELSSPSPASESTPETCAPDWHLTQQTAAVPSSASQYRTRRHPLQPWPAPAVGPAVRFDKAQLAMFTAQNANMASLKDELTIAAGKVTPGVDDTPHIQYAIDALMRNRDGYGSDQLSDGDFEDEMRGVSPPALTHPPVSLPEPSFGGRRGIRRQSSRVTRSSESSHSSQRRPISQDDQFRPLSPVSSRVYTPLHAPHQPQQSQYHHSPSRQPPPGPPTPLARPSPELWVPVTRQMRDNFYPNETAYPPLTFKPRLLRPFSLIIFVGLCLLMTAALVVSAVYSDRRIGLAPYPGTIYSGYYFLFRILPQILAAIILIYAQAVTSASLRVLPFAAMASEDARHRYLALFKKLYPSAFLWPQLSGPWQLRAFGVASWLALFTVPLQSSLFTCILVDGQWRWAPTTGILWTLVALYIIMAAAAGVLLSFWFGKWTGLMWDVRSLADLITLLSRSNALQSYESATMATSAMALKSLLRDRWFDRLGYWRGEDNQTGGIWYGIGASGTPTDQDLRLVHELMGKRASHNPSIDSHDDADPKRFLPESRHCYLPFALRDAPLIAFAATAGSLLVALLIVSFLPQTRLEAGFLPLLPAKPDQAAAFSAANFLYSFLPSLLGMVLFLLLQSLDLALRTVRPWGELARPEGGIARKSILADYAAACHPIEAAWRATRAGHWRVAVVSLLTALSLGIPILAGGLFMALTTADGQVRIFPSIPVYGVLLALLFLYVGALTLLLPRRHGLRLPHAVTSLASIISLCSAEELTRDAAFRSVRSHADLEARLGVDKTSDPRDESEWYLGVVPGKDERRLSVRRQRRFTEKVSAGRHFTSSMV